MEAEQALNCIDVAWWMHHSISLLEGHYERIPQ